MKTTKLSVLDRLLLPQLLIQAGGKIEMILVESIVRKIEFTPDEITQFGLKDNNGFVSWSNSKEVEFEFSSEQVEILKRSAQKADEEKKVTVQNLPLIQKIDSL